MEIYSMNPDGSGVAKLTNWPSSLEASPHWPRDGTQLVFLSSRTGSGDIYKMKANGTAPTRLTTSTQPETNPQRSPTRDEIVFVRDGDLDVMNTAGGAIRRLTNTSPAETSPSWSPDGNRIAFGVLGQSRGITTIDRTGSGRTRLTTGADNEPDWSPDGTKIAFTSNRDGNFEIYRMSSTGANRTRLTTSPGPDVGPAWTP